MSTPASGSGAGSGAPSEQPSIPTQPAKRRRYARRSCLTCRSKKTRCELPDEAVASSHDPLPVYKACHRCRALDIPCVVWDGNRKRKPRIQPASSSSCSSTPHTRTQLSPAHPAPPRDPSRHLDIAYPTRRPHDAYSDHMLSRSNHRSARPYAQDNPHPTHDWHSSPSATDTSVDRLSPRRAELYKRSRHPPNAALDANPPPPPHQSRHPPLTKPTSPAPTAPYNPTPSDGHFRAALFINPESAESITKENVAGHQVPILSTRFMHSPLITLNRFITKIPSFSRLLRPEMDRPLDGQLSALLTDQDIDELQQHLPRLRMWHPHLPDLETLRAASRQRASPSTSLLLAITCFAASKIAGKRHLAKHFAVNVDRLGLQVLISAPKELHAVQALELLLSHGPSLIGASVDNASTPSDASPAFGETLQSSATLIAESIGVDLAMSQASQQGLLESAATSPDQIQRLRAHLRRFSLWCSLSIWRTKFVFFNSTLRPYDFSRLRHDAELAISTIDKLRQLDHDKAIDISTDEIFFRAGVLALSYRAIQVADVHSRLSQLDTLWNSRPLFSELEIRNEVSSRIEQYFESLQSLQKAKRQKLWSMANLPELKFLDRWIDLEFESDWTCCFQLYMRMVLPISKAEGTLLDVSHMISRDASLFRFMFDSSKASYLSNERALAAFAGTPRFEAENLEQTGLPLLLTCGYVLHISICLMESVGFNLTGHHESSIRGEMFAILFPKLADRLCEPSRHESESLQKLVASMLVQMTRRLEDYEFTKATRGTRQPSSLSMSQPVIHAGSDHSHQRATGVGGAGVGHPGQPAYQPNQMNPSTPQHHATPSSDSSGVTRTDLHSNTPSSGWQDASSSAGQPPLSKHSLGSLMHPQPGQAPTSDPVTSVGGQYAVATATDATAPALTAADDAHTILSASDVWASSDNMTRIMDQILSWDCLPDMQVPNCN